MAFQNTELKVLYEYFLTHRNETIEILLRKRGQKFAFGLTTFCLALPFSVGLFMLIFSSQLARESNHSMQQNNSTCTNEGYIKGSGVTATALSLYFFMFLLCCCYFPQKFCAKRAALSLNLQEISMLNDWFAENPDYTGTLDNLKEDFKRLRKPRNLCEFFQICSYVDLLTCIEKIERDMLYQQEREQFLLQFNN